MEVSSKHNMRNTVLSLIAMLWLTAAADEGMWTLYNLPNAVYEQMRQEGYELPYDALYHADDAVMKAVVNFSGYCTGVVVSPDGLVFTNHHCGFDAIRSHSTVEHDYMLDGFVAKSYEEELPNKNMFVSFMVDQRDITPLLDSLGIPQDKWREKADSIESVLQKQAREQDSTLRVEVLPFYERNRYFATTYRDFRDLRLVFTIPKSMGKFGGDTDNWMWPRQTCDFSVFRIYADPKTNGPAEYSEDNVPYHPQNWARVSMDGYVEGDFAMTLGYPGSTNRYLSSYGIREIRDGKNAPRAQVRGVKQTIMKRHMDASKQVRIKYDSKYASSANYWKNAIGMNKCIDSIGLIREKAEYEARLRQWMDSTGLYSGKLDFSLLERLYEKRFKAARTLTIYYETFGRRNTDELTRRATRVHTGGVIINGPQKKPKKQYIEFKNTDDTWDGDTDREILAALLKNYREQVEIKYHPDFFNLIDHDYGGDFQRFVDHLYKDSKLMKSDKRIYVNRESYRHDPGVEYGLSITEVLADIEADMTLLNDSIDEQEKYLCAAKLRMEEDMPNYSDANFSMRLSYGQVKEYQIGGHPSGYYTDAPSLLRKMQQGDRIEDYRVEPEMKTLLSATDFAPYADATTGKMQPCFLTTNDITGGNSGSPIFDGLGRLIGLAFDGNWDSLSSDIFFDSQLARCVGVDVRFVLFMIDRWGHADRLLRELGIANSCSGKRPCGSIGELGIGSAL